MPFSQFYLQLLMMDLSCISIFKSSCISRTVRLINFKLEYMMKICILWILNRYYKKFCMSKENRYFLRVLHWISIFLKNRCSKMAVSPDRFYLIIRLTINPWHLLEGVLVSENHCSFLKIRTRKKKKLLKKSNPP